MPARNTRMRWIAAHPSLIVGLAFFGLCLLSMPVILQGSGDATAETSRALMVQEPIRSNHLLVTTAYRWWLSLTPFLANSLPAFVRLQVLTALVGACSVALLHKCLRVMGCSARASLGLALLLGLSYGHWLHARESETDIIPEALLIACLCLLAAARKRETARALVLSAGAALMVGLAVMFSLNFVLLLPGLALYPIFFFCRSLRLRAALLFGALCAVIVVGGSWLGYAAQAHSWTLGEFVHWLSHHSEEEGLGRVGLNLKGLLRSLVGIQVYFTGPSTLTSLAKDALVNDGARLHIGALDIGRVVLGVGIATGLGLASLQVRGVEDGRKSLIFTGICVLPSLLFCTLWLGSDPQFWIPVIPFLLCHIGFLNAAGAPALRGGVGRQGLGLVALTTLFLFNLPYPVPTLAWSGGGREWRQAQALDSILHEGDLVAFPAGYPRYLRTAHIDLVNLYYDNRLRENRPQAIPQLLDRIEHTLRAGGNALVVELYTVENPTAVGYWEMIKNAFGYDRATLIAAIENRFSVSPVQRPELGRSAIALKLRGD